MQEIDFYKKKFLQRELESIFFKSEKQFQNEKHNNMKFNTEYNRRHISTTKNGVVNSKLVENTQNETQKQNIRNEKRM